MKTVIFDSQTGCYYSSLLNWVSAETTIRQLNNDFSPVTLRDIKNLQETKYNPETGLNEFGKKIENIF